MASESNSLPMKRQFIAALETLPDDATLDDAIECLHFVYKVRVGLAQLDQGMGIPHDEAMKRISKWLR